jgi:hypothetical protein
MLFTIITENIVSIPSVPVTTLEEMIQTNLVASELLQVSVITIA